MPLDWSSQPRSATPTKGQVETQRRWLGMPTLWALGSARRLATPRHAVQLCQRRQRNQRMELPRPMPMLVPMLVLVLALVLVLVLALALVLALVLVSTPQAPAVPATLARLPSANNAPCCTTGSGMPSGAAPACAFQKPSAALSTATWTPAASCSFRWCVVAARGIVW